MFTNVTVGCLFGVLVGYLAGVTRGRQATPAHRFTLATVLREIGVAPESITHFQFIGDEHSFTSGRVATDTNVAWIWDRMIHTAEPYSFWEASGNRRVEVFTRGNQQPAAVLLVNATDATSVAGDDRRFMCHGLHDLAMRLLSLTETAFVSGAEVISLTVTNTTTGNQRRFVTIDVRLAASVSVSKQATLCAIVGEMKADGPADEFGPPQNFALRGTSHEIARNHFRISVALPLEKIRVKLLLIDKEKVLHEQAREI